MTRKIMNLIKVKRKLRRNYLKNHDYNIKRQINTLKHEIKKEIKIQTIRNWNRTCENINNETNSRKFWKKISQITNPCKKSNSSYPNLVSGRGEEVINPQDQANLFANYYSSIFTTPIHEKFDSNFMQLTDSFVKDNLTSFTPEFITQESDHPQ